MQFLSQIWCVGKNKKLFLSTFNFPCSVFFFLKNIFLIAQKHTYVCMCVCMRPHRNHCLCTDWPQHPCVIDLSPIPTLFPTPAWTGNDAPTVVTHEVMASEMESEQRLWVQVERIKAMANCLMGLLFGLSLQWHINMLLFLPRMFKLCQWASVNYGIVSTVLSSIAALALLPSCELRGLILLQLRGRFCNL